MGALFLLAFLAAAPSPLPDDPAFNEGLRLLEDFEYEKAIFRFREAARDEAKTPKQRAICLVYVGLTLAELREEGSAAEAFEDAVRADPFVTLPPDASPKVKEMLDAARRRVAEAQESAPATEPPADPYPTADPGAEPAAPASPPPDEGGGMLFLASGGTLAALGGVALVGSGGLLALALVFNQQAEAAEFADEAAGFRDQSVGSQIGAVALLGTGALLVAGGAALLVVGLME